MTSSSRILLFVVLEILQILLYLRRILFKFIFFSDKYYIPRLRSSCVYSIIMVVMARVSLQKKMKPWRRFVQKGSQSVTNILYSDGFSIWNIYPGNYYIPIILNEKDKFSCVYLNLIIILWILYVNDDVVTVLCTRR